MSKSFTNFKMRSSHYVLKGFRLLTLKRMSGTKKIPKPTYFFKFKITLFTTGQVKPGPYTFPSILIFPNMCYSRLASLSSKSFFWLASEYIFLQYRFPHKSYAGSFQRIFHFIFSEPEFIVLGEEWCFREALECATLSNCF